jgi:hypothetical protein
MHWGSSFSLLIISWHQIADALAIWGYLETSSFDVDTPWLWEKADTVIILIGADLMNLHANKICNRRLADLSIDKQDPCGCA